MHRIDLASAFKRDYKRESKGRHKEVLQVFVNSVQLLAKDEPLPARYRDQGWRLEEAEESCPRRIE